MVSTDSTAHLRFLEQASEALSVTAPAVSSHLRVSKRDAAVSYGVDAETSENACSACGRGLLLGWSCEPLRTAGHRQTRQQRISGDGRTTRCVECSTCGTENTIKVQKRAKAQAAKASNRVQKRGPSPALQKEIHVSEPQLDPAPILPSPPAKEQTPETTQPKPTARRKARGKNASLQALLANKKEAPKSSGFGLGFMDFMK